MPATKYLFVSGGVISGLGKGITAASLGLILKSAGFKVTLTKADMYLNVDAGTMNPLEHGEVFVTDDGIETDQDLGHYERFLNESLTKKNYFTMGKVYWDVLQKERALGYGGKCVEGHVHIPEEIIRKVKESGVGFDISIIEVGGTVGEFQNMMFFEAIRRMKQMEPENVFLTHVVYLPIPEFLGEMKSKPAQASIYELYRLGLQPDFVVCRSDVPIDDKRKSTIAFNTGIKKEHIFDDSDVDTIYKVPTRFEEQGMKDKVLKEMGIKKKKKDLVEWRKMLESIAIAKREVRVAIAGKYFTSGNFSLEDSYVCVIEAIKHACWENGAKPVIKWFDVEKLNTKELGEFDGIIVPQGWGSRGVEGKIETVKYAREKKVPYLGLCFGMQMAVIEYARDVLKLKEANSEEANPKTPHPVIHIMPEQKKYLEEHNYGGTIRLGSWPCIVKKGTLLEQAYEKYGKAPNLVIRGQLSVNSELKNYKINKLDDSLKTGKLLTDNLIFERHRHRYEFNNDYRERLEQAGLVISGVSPDGKLVEAIELPRDKHPFFVATQFHPEYKSRPLSPHPIFVAFVKAALENRR